MRKVYILRENEEDGRVLDALLAAGISTDESEFENPECPRCGCSTMLAYVEEGEYQVITWSEYSDLDDVHAESWYLVCGQFTCPFEEEVQVVNDPMGADIFDLELAYYAFDEYSGMSDRHTTDMRNLIGYFKELQRCDPSRKIQSFLEEAEWRLEDDLKEARKWVEKVPSGKRVRFCVEADEITGTFVTATEDGLMVLKEPSEELVVVKLTEIYHHRPLDPDQDELPKDPKEILALFNGSGEEPRKNRFIMIHCGRDMVVIRGWHLQLGHVDKFGQYHVRCWEKAAAEALELRQRAENYWEGEFRRSDVEERYERREMLRVKGYWVEVYGSCENMPAIRTEDPETAEALEMESHEPWRPLKTDAEKARWVPYWTGLVPEDQVEERKSVRFYVWPLPEARLQDGRS